jgi:uncharacterized protein YPO0396
MDTGTHKTPVLSQALRELAFVLTELEVYNWGAFAGRHVARFELEGTAIIGPTGSGKTTLVDALMTLLTANPRYNLASTGGHQSDRELVSYVRGVTGAGNKSGDNDHIARPGTTVTAISARFSNGTEDVTVGALLHLEGTSSAASDLKRWWVFSQAPGQGLEQWLTLHHEGGARALKQLARETPGLQVHDSKNAYLAQLRRFFEVGENAFALLNRAAGLKQIDSIDEIFRELVLEDASAFDRAAEVARQFDDLAAIHAELEVARTQRDSLQPVQTAWQERQRLLEELGRYRELRTALPIWYAMHGHRLWTVYIAELDERILECSQREEELGREIHVASGLAEALRDAYLRAGGTNVEQLRELIEAQNRFVKDRSRYAEEYRKLTRRLGLEETLSIEALLANQQHAKQQHALQSELQKQLTVAAFDAGSAQQQCRTEQLALEQELREARVRPGSNIPAADHQFRAALAEHLGLGEDELPYVAELIEVKAEESGWRGAIERAIGGHRLRILVPEAQMHSALGWVNDRDNRLHVRLLEVRLSGSRGASGPSARSDEGSGVARQWFADSYLHKLNFKPHAALGALQGLLAGQDRHCVESAEILRNTAHGMTRQGLMSGRTGQFDKQDQKPLDRDWMTGFDNKARLMELTRRLGAAQSALAESQRVYEAAQDKAEGARHNLTLLEALLQMEFATIDLPGALKGLEALEARLTALNAPGSDTEQARVAWEEADGKLKALRERETALAAREAEFQTNRKYARNEQEKSFRRLAGGLTDSLHSLAAQHLREPIAAELPRLDEIERDAASVTQQSISSLEGRLKDTEQALIRAMERAKKVDTGALSEVGTDLAEGEQYLERLTQLMQEALPEKLQRFLDYLNQSSDQGVTQLLSWIENQVSTIEERLEDLNVTLRRVDFQPQRYLRLQPVRVTHDSLREVEQARRHLRSAMLKDDQGESHFKALRNMVELLRDASDRRTTVGARALLDPRYRLHFEVSVIARDTGAVIEVRTGSQGGSGGEKEIIASYVLTASLSYALAAGGRRPLFGTVVLDEAFSKSSHAVASRIISALTEFGLHPLFVTPNKELRLLRDHTRSAILVHRRGSQATLTSLSWEELEEHARQRKVLNPPADGSAP